MKRLYICMLFPGVSKCVFVQKASGGAISMPTQTATVRSPLLALRFRVSVSTAKTTGQCLLSVAITLLRLISDLCHADKKKKKEHSKALAVFLESKARGNKIIGVFQIAWFCSKYKQS